MKLRIALAAERDLREIAAHIARDNPTRARSFIRELKDKMRNIAAQPMIYPVREAWGADNRSALHRNYQIIYRIDGETVLFLRLLHGTCDIGSVLKDTE